jgi:hypothetical protein
MNQHGAKYAQLQANPNLEECSPRFDIGGTRS